MWKSCLLLTKTFILLLILASTNSLKTPPTVHATRRTFMTQSSLVVVAHQVLGVATIVNSGVLPAFAATEEDFSSGNVESSTAATTKITSDDGGGATGVTVFKLKSGLQFIDLVPGSGPSPNYGQLCTIKYTAYVQLPKAMESKTTNINTLQPQLQQLQRFDSDSFLLKHGNGRLISGLDEGLHTMKVGGQRRIIIPPKLGFVGNEADNALGPIPQSPWAQYRLNQLLSQMVQQRGGKLIYDVELLQVREDEADQGYYSDMSLTEEQFDTLRDNIQKQGKLDRGTSTTVLQ